MNIGIALGMALREKGSSCQVYSSDLRVAMDDSKHYFYPDVSVFCDPPIESEIVPHALTNPSLIVEVISDSTERLDRGPKFQAYYKIPSLKAYVLINPRGPLVEFFIRQDEKIWTFRPALGPDEVLELPHLGISIRVEDIYRGVKFEPEHEGGEVHEVYGIYYTQAMMET